MAMPCGATTAIDCRQRSSSKNKNRQATWTWRFVFRYAKWLPLTWPQPEGEARRAQALEDRGPQAKRNGLEQIRRTASRPVIAERIHALAWRIQAHLVG